MATDNSVSKNQKANIIVIAGNDETFQNLLSIIQKSEKRSEIDDITKHLVSLLKLHLYNIKYKLIYSRTLNLWMTK